VSDLAGSVWGVHDYVASYMAAGSSSGELIDSETVRWVPGSSGPSGCGWYRVIVPLAELGRHGWKTQWRAGVPPQAADDYRIITAQRLDKQTALRPWRNLRLRHRLVYETDDDIFSVPEERWTLATYRQNVMQDVVAHAARIADIVTVSTEPLAEVYRKLGCPEIRVLPNCVPGGLLTLERNRHRKKLVVGWAGGGSHGPDIKMITEPLREFIDGHPKAELHLVGCDFSDEIGRRCRFTEWVPADESLAYYRQLDFDIGLAPLTGTVFDASKSGIKLLEYFALGIPALASDCEAYRDVMVDGVTGYLIRRPGDWGRRLRELANDHAAREEMSVKAREVARAHTIEANWHRWAGVYRELL